MLDRTEQRVVGVLVEMGLVAPEAYPAAEFDLRLGCNRYDHRDPVMDLKPFEIAGALMSLLENGWIERLDAGVRGSRFRHLLVERLALAPVELGVLCELLLHGAQTVAELGERMQRLSLASEKDEVESALLALARRPKPLAAPLAPRARESGSRWVHLLGRRRPERETLLPVVAVPAQDVAGAGDADAGIEAGDGLEHRVHVLEAAVERIEARLSALDAARLDEVLLGR